MRIAHVTLYPPKGEKHVSTSGVASYSKNLITNLAEDGDQQIVICEKREGKEDYREDGIEVHRSFDRSPSFVLQVHRELKLARPDVIHIQQELALFGGIATAYLLQWLVYAWRSRVIITLHGVVDPNKIDAAFVKENNSRLPVWLVQLAFRIIYRPLMKWPAKVIVHEDYFKEIMVNSYSIPPEKIEVIPHGVESLQAVAQGAAKKQLSLPREARVVLFMGYATGYKGLDLLIEGFGAYAKRDKKAYLLIGAGKHPKLYDNPAYLTEYERLQAKAKKLLPQEQYDWRGFIKEEEIATCYGASDVSVYPYTTAMSSSGPMSFAIGYEKPFLVSTAFGDIFKGYPLLLFERTPTSLADKLEYFFTHQAAYDSFSATLKKERNWSRVAAQTLQAYRNMNDPKGFYEREEDTITG